MRAKGRPRKSRFVKKEPKVLKFSPRGKPGRPDEIGLRIEEIEAIRLIDLHGHKQKEAAKSMRISQQTLSRVVRSARRKLSDGIITGKIIKIQGGDYVIYPSQIDLRT